MVWKWWKDPVHPSGFHLLHKERETVKPQFPTSTSPWEKNIYKRETCTSF